MNTLISVIIPTHNPNPIRLEKTLLGLQNQQLPYSFWELLIIDNASTNRELFNYLDFSWHSAIKVIREENLGLTRARLAGIQASKGNYIVFVDDDNVLRSDYLKNVISIFQEHPNIGVIGGKSLPEFEVKPESWIKNFWVCLALRDLGEEVQIYSYNKTFQQQKQYPSFAPIGAGMVLQRSAAKLYAESILTDLTRLSLDRTGKNLQSGGDCDINLTLLDAGWEVGYFPQLQIAHIIPPNRLTREYLAKLNFATSRSWIQVLDFHGIRPWKKISRWSVLPRKVKALFNYQPWKNSTAYINWQGACGMFEGLSNLS